MPLVPGSTFSPYSVTAKIGEGVSTGDSSGAESCLGMIQFRGRFS